MEGSVEAETVEEIDRVIGQIRGLTVLLAVVTVLALAFTTTFAVTDHPKWATASLVAGSTSLLVLVAMLFTAVFSDAEVRYHSGFSLAMILTGCAVTASGWLMTGFERGRRPLVEPIAGQHAAAAPADRAAGCSLVLCLFFASLVMISGVVLLLTGMTL